MEEEKVWMRRMRYQKCVCAAFARNSALKTPPKTHAFKSWGRALTKKCGVKIEHFLA